LLCSDLRYVKDGAIGHVVPSGALRTMRSVAYRTSINPRECKHGGARHTTLPDFGSVHSLVFFIYYGSQSIADDILFLVAQYPKNRISDVQHYYFRCT